MVAHALMMADHLSLLGKEKVNAMLKKAKGVKVSVYDTGIEFDGGRNFLLYMVDDPNEQSYDFWLGARGCGHIMEMFGLMKEDGLEFALETAEANLLDRNCMVEMFYAELDEKELIAELGCPIIEEFWSNRR